MDWKKFFKPTIGKILLFVFLLLVFTLIFGVPVKKFVLCEPCPPPESGLSCTPCQKTIEFITIKNLIESQEFIGKGIWLVWYLYIIEFIFSYLISCIIIYFLKINKNIH